MGINFVDTTLRDGEQKACIALNVEQKVKIAKIIDDMGIDQIEAGVPAMGGDEKKSIEKIMSLDLKSKISSWNRMSIKDIDDSVDCGVDIIHISIPSSDIQIRSKLGKDREWVINNMRNCITYAIDKGYEVTVGLEDASRADINFLIELCTVVFEIGVKRVRYADTVGILYPRKIFYNIKKLMKEVPLEVEIHAHNDFGMALPNSFGAVEAGAKFVNCTITGMGERAGNCDFIKFVEVMNKLYDKGTYSRNFSDLIEMEETIRNIINYD
ncbi:homocitrate synthase NifV [Clostridium algifaecis]|uniref:Homocitrate synthase NifV n=1 Tax=Clostridium algifaecis TaxID=1472040 RepID=A0ABS4KQ35_9CLOT|nr:homocitrate synthase [Clostridium algifaecis]MBP2032144.1 homocitrate synthase NifV [Clostridium algifaecis]